MASKLSLLRRPLSRRIPNSTLVVSITAQGVIIRGYRRRKHKLLTWEQIASLSDDSEPLIKACECGDGLRMLQAMGAIIAPEAKPNA